jgi:hypothetical protein
VDRHAEEREVTTEFGLKNGRDLSLFRRTRRPATVDVQRTDRPGGMWGSTVAGDGRALVEAGEASPCRVTRRSGERGVVTV